MCCGPEIIWEAQPEIPPSKRLVALMNPLDCPKKLLCIEPRNPVGREDGTTKELPARGELSWRAGQRSELMPRLGRSLALPDYEISRPGRVEGGTPHLFSKKN